MIQPNCGKGPSPMKNSTSLLESLEWTAEQAQEFADLLIGDGPGGPIKKILSEIVVEADCRAPAAVDRCGSPCASLFYAAETKVVPCDR